MLWWGADHWKQTWKEEKKVVAHLGDIFARLFVCFIAAVGP